MTNAAIIFQESCKLMDEGKIGTTGRFVQVENGDGELVTLMEPEPIHTYKKWNELGYQVERGQKCIAEIMIWKAGKGKQESDENEPPETKLFLKKAFFFTRAQVKPIEKK